MQAPFPMSCDISHTFSRLPHAIPRPPTQAISPYGIAVSPYNHTPDASPHTSRQIPIGRPFSHSHTKSPIARPSPHMIRKLSKAGFHFDETSGSSSANPQPTLSSKHPGPALQSPQTKRRPSPANATCLLGGGGAVTSCAHVFTGMRTLSCTYAYTFTGVRIPSRVCAYLHGHAHIFTGTRTAMASGHASAETSVRLEQIYAPNRPTQMP